MDMDKRFPHYTPIMRDLLEAAWIASANFQQRPHKNSKDYGKWEKANTMYMQRLAAHLTLFGLVTKETPLDTQEDK